MNEVLLRPTRERRPSLSEELLRRFDTPGPRYTSYPTADRFAASFGADDALAALRQRAAAGSQGAPLSVYVHVPFCESLCYYCACNKIITKRHERGGEYLDALDREIALYTAVLGRGQRVSQLHFGGGSPTFLSDAELDRLMGSLRRAFEIAPSAEISIEVDPRTVTPLRLAHCRQLGFNRVSLGVQDFDPSVQKAVHRVQSFEMVQELVQSARGLGYHSINADLIYGLPKQTPPSFARTVEQIGEIRPDRIALYAYAHLPQRVKSQRHIAQADLPTAADRVAMLGGAIAGFLDRGYDYIGMDHFALAGDSLAIAKREGRMQRNFQGYSTQPDCDLIGLGVSAIGRIGASYQQNAKAIGEYYAAVRADRLPIERGIGLEPDDVVRHDVIMSLMCQGRLEFDAVERKHGIDFRVYFASELEQLAPYAEAGLVAIEPAALQVGGAGWYVVRAIAMVFDRYLSDDQERSRFSRIL